MRSTPRSFLGFREEQAHLFRQSRKSFRRCGDGRGAVNWTSERDTGTVAVRMSIFYGKTRRSPHPWISGWDPYVHQSDRRDVHVADAGAKAGGAPRSEVRRQSESNGLLRFARPPTRALSHMPRQRTSLGQACERPRGGARDRKPSENSPTHVHSVVQPASDIARIPSTHLYRSAFAHGVKYTHRSQRNLCSQCHAVLLASHAKW